MITHFLGSIPMGGSYLTGPTGQSISRANTFAQYDVTRGKPVLHEIGEELDTQQFSFFFSEEFCSPGSELAKLEAAYALKTPMPLTLGSGAYVGKHYVVEALDIDVVKTDRRGGVVRVEASISLVEAPVGSLTGLLNSIARGRAPGISAKSGINPSLKR